LFVKIKAEEINLMKQLLVYGDVCVSGDTHRLSLKLYADDIQAKSAVEEMRAKNRIEPSDYWEYPIGRSIVIYEIDTEPVER